MITYPIFVFQMSSSAQIKKEDEDPDQDIANYKLKIFKITGKDKLCLS